MNLGWKHLAGQLLNGADLSKASLEEIDILLEEYPYFAGLHFLKAAKAKASQTDDLSGSYAKAALYFPNPHWYALLLDQSIDGTVTQASPIYHEEVVKEDVLPVEAVETSHFADEIVVDNGEEIAAEILEPIPEMQEPEPLPQADWEQNLAENPVFQQHQISDEEQVEKETWQQQASEPVNEPSIEEISHISEEEIEPEAIPAAVESLESEEFLSNVPAGEHDITEAFHPEPSIPSEDMVILPETEEEPVLHTVAEQDTEPEAVIESLPAPEPEKTAEPLQDDLGIPFEPLYTIDYFASQGIKIAAEASPKDQLSLKLRSFTEWLRAMKKLHPEKIDKDFNQDQEEQVRVIAESSNAPQIVYTEAMAEVFIKQGKKDKARQVYEKLSLLDPGKSAYFAVRIKELKEN